MNIEIETPNVTLDGKKICKTMKDNGFINISHNAIDLENKIINDLYNKVNDKKIFGESEEIEIELLRILFNR